MRIIIEVYIKCYRNMHEKQSWIRNARARMKIQGQDNTISDVCRRGKNQRKKSSLQDYQCTASILNQ